MYFPILRGKQYELLAIREFANEINNSPIICPVIEPVKKSFKSLETATKNLTSENVNFTIILNPQVGEVAPSDMIGHFLSSDSLTDNDNFQIGIHINSEKQLKREIQLIKKNNLERCQLVLIHHDPISAELYNEISKEFRVKFNFINSNIKARRYKHLFDPTTKVHLEDVFDLKERNVDYLDKEDQSFSDIYLYFEEEGYVGFSDYLTIGESYADGGFLPYAVAIHLTYSTGDEIRIRHFVSDSNDDYSDTPGKFSEALKKLVEFTSELSFKTKAISVFEEYYATGHYPGLGSIKKLSILNHLELVKHLLTRRSR